MDSDKDIFGKADALLRRHAVQAPSDPNATGGVPVLTDFIEDPDRGATQPSPATPAAEAIAPEALARAISKVEARLALQLEERIMRELLPQVHAAVAHALGDLRQELGNAIGDAVTEALRHRQDV